MLVLVPSKRTASFDANKREWAESEDEGASPRNHTYVKRWGYLFTSYNGIRLAQTFVMPTMAQQLLIGGCTGFMAGGSNALATAQVVLVMPFANVGFAAFAYLRPLAQTPRLKMHIYNADGCISAGKCPPQAQLLCDQLLPIQLTASTYTASTYASSTYMPLFCVCNPLAL
jgi:hypothetical protein